MDADSADEPPAENEHEEDTVETDLPKQPFLRRHEPKWYRNLRFRRADHKARQDMTLLEQSTAQENERGRLPHGEEIHLAGIWIAELYLPSQLQPLLAGLKRLGWEVGRWGGDKDVTDWIRDGRERPGGWMSLGRVDNLENKNIMTERVATLPEGITAAFPNLISLGSGLSALVMLFVFEDGLARTPTDLLNAEYAVTPKDVLGKTFGDGRIKRFLKRVAFPILPHWLFNVSQQFSASSSERSAAVQGWLREQRQSCSTWVRDYLPGAFSCQKAIKEFPSIQFLVTEKNQPLRPDADVIDAFRTAGLTHSSLRGTQSRGMRSGWWRPATTR